MMEHRESKRFILRTLTPVFIGSGECLNKSQFIYEPKENKVNILDLNKWKMFLYTKGLIEEYAEYIRKCTSASNSKNTNANGVNLRNWLEIRNIYEEEYSSLVKYSITAANNIDKSNLNDIHLFTKDVYMQPYIPGSSIKGAIRTAVLFYIIDQNKAKYLGYWNELKAENLPKKIGPIVSRLEKEILEIYNKSNNYKSTAVNDVFSGLQVSDSLPVTAQQLMVFRRQDVSTYTKGVAELPIYIEYLKPMTELPFFITIDQTVFGCMKKYGIESIADILRILQYFQDRVVKEVYPIFSEYMQTFSYSKDGTVPNFSIGGSAGYHTKSIVAALAPNSKEANDYVKKIMANNFRQHKHMELDHKIAPRTLKVEKYANEYLPVGLCRIEEKL